MATIDPVIVKIQADVNDLKTGLQKAQESLKGLDDSVKKADSGFSAFATRVKQVGATLGVTFAASQVVSFFKDSVAAAREAEAAQARLATLLRNTNGATEEQIVALNEQAKALEAVGVVSADNVTVAQSQLATFDLAASSIKTLTPAILDYVTAEKGAAASADDFKQMTNGLAQALNGQFGSLTRLGFVMDDATKKTIASGTESERAAALVEVLNTTYKGFNENLRNTSAGIKQVAINDFNNLKQTIGESLQPVLDNFNKFLSDTLFPAITKFVKVLTENKDTIIAVSKVLLAGVAAFAAYKAIVAVTTGVTKAFQVVMTLVRGQQLATIASTNTLAASMARLNAVMRANPIGVVITAVTLLAAGFVALWNKSETFRKVVIAVAKAALNAFASIVPMVGKVGEAIAKFMLAPLKTILQVLSKLPGVGKFAKAGLDILNKGLEGISDFSNKAAAKATELSKKLDGMAKIAKKAGEDTKKAVEDPFKGDTRGDKGGGLTDKQKSKLAKYKEDVKKVYKDINDVIKDAEDKRAEAATRRDERIAEARERYREIEEELNARYNERIAEADDRYEETKAELKDRRRKAEEAATKKHAESILAIQVEYSKREIELQKTRDKKLADLEAAAQKKREDIIEKGAEKLRAIVEKSRQRLRDAWTKGTDFKLEDLFGAAKTSGGSIVDAIKKQLAQTKDLQKGAGELAGKGFNQAFIEQIVQAGPAAGLEMIEQIRKLSPEQEKELIKLYDELVKINDTGLDALANNLSTATNLATAELRTMYEATQNDITDALAEINTELKVNIAEANAAYNEAIAEAAKIRDTALAEADKALKEALEEAKVAYDEALADALKTLNKAKEDAKKDLDKGLADAQRALQKALLDAQNDFDKALDAIDKAMTAKINSLMEKLRQLAAQMAAISSSAARGVLAGAPDIPTMTITPEAYGGGVTVTTSPSLAATAAKYDMTPEKIINAAAQAAVAAVGGSNNVTINGFNLADPEGTAQAIVSVSKYGQTVQVATTKKTGIQLTGLNAIRAGITRVAE